MKIDEFEFQDKNGNEIEPSKSQLVIYIKSLHKQIAKLKQAQKELVISELEKLKDFFLEPYVDEDMGSEFIITKDADNIADYVLDRIKELKEKKQ